MKKIIPIVIPFVGILLFLQLSLTGSASATSWILVACGFGLFGFWLKSKRSPIEKI